MDQFFPYGRHWIDDDDIAAVVEVLKSDALTCGPQVELFEKAFALTLGAEEAVVVNSGTAALHLASIAAGLCEGKKAVVPAVTFLATANAVRMTGADVVFADVDPETGLMTQDTLRAAMETIERDGGRVDAVLPVHLNGHIVEMAEIAPIVREKGAQLIVDCCHALGGCYPPSGTLNDISGKQIFRHALETDRVGEGIYEDFACFSLHPVKNIAMGEGGVITLNDKAVADRLRRLRSHGLERRADQWHRPLETGEKRPWYYEMHEIGYNYRAPDILCALALSQLSKLDIFTEKRRNLARRYEQGLKKLAPVIKPVPVSKGESGWHLFPVLVDFEVLGVSRGAFMERLKEKSVGTQVHYIPLHHQPYYRERYGEQDLPGADRYYKAVLSLPLYPRMDMADVDTVMMRLEETIAEI